LIPNEIFAFREKIFCATQALRPGSIGCAASFETRAARGVNSPLKGIDPLYEKETADYRYGSTP
jgi:hypothetical protein